LKSPEASLLDSISVAIDDALRFEHQF
jgi:hypothetical protein